MPEMIPLGWFHTVMGIIAISSGVYTLAKHKEITLRTWTGQLYLGTTLITAATALGIYQTGEFGPGHMLAVMTLLALALGGIAAGSKLFGRLSRYVEALGFSSTLFFHSLPAVTDGLLRLPVGNPVLTSIEDPVLKICYAAFFLTLLIGLTFQFRWISRQF